MRFDEVIGQKHITDTLKRAIQTEKVAHAFLFCGPHGVGKTTCARILAKALNCLKPTEDKEPCNECASCTSFNDSASFNIIELDAASHNKVENIRSLIEQVNIAPQGGSRKVFIIDEVHMLSSSAFNAFLKTLEEPPDYAIFILATTEKHKILPTILSRCQIYDFKRIDINDIVQNLREICKSEDVETDDEALHIIAQKADGAMRDALSMFDRLSNLVDGSISYQDVISNLGMVDYGTYFKITDHLLSEDAAGALMVLDRAINEGYDAEEIIKGLARHLRNLYFYSNQKLQPLVRLPESLLSKYRSQAALTKEAFLVNGLDMLSEVLYRAQLSPDAGLAYEITLTKLAYLRRLVEHNDSQTDGIDTAASASSKKKEVSPAGSTLKSPAIDGEKAAEKDREHDDMTEDKEEESSEESSTLAQSAEVRPKEADVEPEEEVKDHSDITDADEETEDPPDSDPPPSSPDTSKKPPPASGQLSLLNLAREVEEESAEEEETRELNADNLKQVWDQYLSTIDSDYIRQLAQSIVLHVRKEGGVELIADHTRVKEAITREHNAIMHIRLAFDDKELPVDITVEEAKKTKEDRRLITNKEKFDYLVEQNPVILELTRRFQLKFD